MNTFVLLFTSIMLFCIMYFSGKGELYAKEKNYEETRNKVKTSAIISRVCLILSFVLIIFTYFFSKDFKNKSYFFEKNKQTLRKAYK